MNVFNLKHLSRAGVFAAAILLPLLAGIGSAGCTRLDGVSLPKPYDALGQVRLMEGILDEQPGYQLLMGEPFENLRPWTSRAASSSLSDIRYIFRVPKGKAYAEERRIIEERRIGDYRFERSLFVHTSIELPGRQQFWFHPKEKIPLQGQLFLASFWVHSNMYLHRLVLLFRNADGREIRVPAGRLTWHGWRRLTVKLPRALYRRGRSEGRQYEHFFTGMLLISHPRQPAGDVALMFDNMLILSDMHEFRFPGTEYRDAW